MTKVLVSDPIDQAGIDILSQVAQVDVRPGLPPAELKQIIGEYDALMIRSGTQVTAEIIESADKLRIIGRAGVGVDNVDVPAATKRGVIVVNSPEGNTIAAAEHALALMLSLSRHGAERGCADAQKCCCCQATASPTVIPNTFLRVVRSPRKWRPTNSKPRRRPPIRAAAAASAAAFAFTLAASPARPRLFRCVT
jgi:hypothetical protein